MTLTRTIRARPLGRMFLQQAMLRMCKVTGDRMKTDEEMGIIRRHWKCNCGDAHFLTISIYGDGDAYLDLHGSYLTCRARFWHRLKECWTLFRSGHADTWVELGLTTQTAREIAKVLSDWADDGDHVETVARDMSAMARRVLALTPEQQTEVWNNLDDASFIQQHAADLKESLAQIKRGEYGKGIDTDDT